MALFQTTANATADADLRINGFMGISETPLRRPGLEDMPLGRESSVCTQVVWILFWLAVLFFVAYPVALVAAIFYVILNPFSLIGNFMKTLMEFLQNTLNFPLLCAQNMADAKQLIAM